MFLSHSEFSKVFIKEKKKNVHQHYTVYIFCLRYLIKKPSVLTCLKDKVVKTLIAFGTKCIKILLVKVDSIT